MVLALGCGPVAVGAETRVEACSANLTMPAHFGARPSAAQQPRAQGSRPNILFVLSDQQRYDFDGHHREIELDVPHRHVESRAQLASQPTGAPSG